MLWIATTIVASALQTGRNAMQSSLTATIGTLGSQFLDHFREVFVRRRFVFEEQCRQLRKRQRLRGGEQRGFDDALQLR